MSHRSRRIPDLYLLFLNCGVSIGWGGPRTPDTANLDIRLSSDFPQITCIRVNVLRRPSHYHSTTFQLHRHPQIYLLSNLSPTHPIAARNPTKGPQTVIITLVPIRSDSQDLLAVRTVVLYCSLLYHQPRRTQMALYVVFHDRCTCPVNPRPLPRVFVARDSPWGYLMN